MIDNSHTGYLKANTVLFAEKVCQALADMTGNNLSICRETLQESSLNNSYPMNVYITFSGTIQGTYICSMDDSVALKLIGAYQEGMTVQQIRDLRQDYCGMIKEMLNLSVGQSIVELEKKFGDLTFFSSTVVFGEIEFPQVLSGKVMIEGREGKILCGFSLNLANIRIGQKLEDALTDLEKKSSEAQEARKNVESILALIPTGLVAIDKKGHILPGYSKSIISVAGVEKDTEIAGTSLAALLCASPEKTVGWENWLDLVFSKFDILPFKDLVGLCELSEFTNTKKKVLKLDWLPCTNDDETKLEKLLVVIEDVTRQRELEQKMTNMNQQHQSNLELISQVINLGPDEVTDFVYDSSQLLTDAQRIVSTNNLDREFINELFRAFHTLKGSSGQYHFKELQEMAHKIEDHLKIFRDSKEATPVDDTAIETIKNSIEDVKGYLSRIEDIRSKLGGKNETLRKKAERPTNTMMVNLEELAKIITSMNGLLDLANKQQCDAILVEGLKSISKRIKDLRKIEISFFISSLESLIENTCSKLKKNVKIALVKDLSLDIEVMRKLHQCFIHLINNAVDHGIEIPEIRRSLGKIEQGVISVSGERVGNAIQIIVEDDGKGIDVDRIKEKIVEKFSIAQSTVDNMSLDEIYGYLLLPGFSTKQEVTEISGRGVGMDVVNNTVKKLGGTVKMTSERGKLTRFTIVLPEEA